VTLKKEDGLKPLKALLADGPVGVLYDEHCMVLIGYSDTQSQFTFQNSWVNTVPIEVLSDGPMATC